MARHGDTRSPSPVGSTYSSSRRIRREDDRYDRTRRDEGRGSRRSRSPEVGGNRVRQSILKVHHLTHNLILQRRYRDREHGRDKDGYRRRDRSIDRRDEDSYRPNRRDRSRERRRSRDRDDDRDYRRRSRDRDYRARRDDSRDRDRRRTDDSADLKHKPRRGDSRDRGANRRSRSRTQEVSRCGHPFIRGAHDAYYFRQLSKPTTPAPAAQTDEQKKAERLAKLELWKAKQAAERERKQQEQAAAGGGRGILDAIDRKSGLPPALGSPKPPGTPTDSPAPYAGKFDPKAIAKNAASTSASTTAATAVLGTDVAVPQTAKAPVKPSVRPADSASAPLKAKGNLSGFGLGAKQAFETDKPSATRTLGFGEEESTRKKLERLPTPPLDDGKDTFTGADDAGDDDDVDMQDGDNEEEAAAAARAAAERREERLQNQQPEANGDIHMEDTSNQEADATEMEVDQAEEVDPLDAFMSDLADTVPPRKTFGAQFSKKKTTEQPQAIFGDEDDVDITAVGDDDADDVLAMATKKKKKEIPVIDHAKVEYEPFRRNFYNEPSHLTDMTEEELATLRHELDGIKVRGQDIPKPVQKWAQCGLGVQTLDVVDRLGFEGLTSVQAQAIPCIMSGRDVIGVAKTGSGKTMAFLIPMFRHIKDQRPLSNMEGPISLIMTPTRELATQIHKDCKPFLKALGLRAVCAYGGAPIKDQIAELKRGAEIVVCTPGRMIDLLAANVGRVTNLRRVTYVVLDEADRMFDMGFEPQVMKILANVRPDRQTVLFSATFPRNMEALARKTLKKPIEIIVGGRSVVAPEITQVVEVRNEDQKFVRLLELLGNLYSDDSNEDTRALIFVDRQESADNLLKELMRKGYPCMSIHGGKDQIDRDSTIEDFKAGIFPILVATSVAARGLDVKQLKLVVNYDAPNHLEDYVHRAGRTGRAGNTGTAVTFLTEDQERYSVDIAKALRQSGQEIPEPVQKMVDAFLEKVKAGKEKASGSGFGGKGLERLDQERETARMRERRTYKTGEEGEDDEEKDEKEKKADDERFNKALSSVQSAAAPAPAPLVGVPKGIDLDGKITVHRTEKDPGAASKNPLDKVGSAVADIHARLSRAGVMRSGVPIDNRGPDAGAFHATLEINDFPQKARWAVTNRTNVAKILEASGTSITTKGSFYATGKEPGPNENPKLYILVEGETEISVTNAMRELMRLLKEGTVAAADSDARAPASGRYSVV
ncbi:Pre-mRNA-processing ATP-dependent RNA helicase prp5 [Penicillium canariense]|uniref:Pre-mRNA-processing ATP-dependent RNA helicase PRP5 n=1 Tax=Penicillium canariense TaxID=189055 RepID=A0A9W9HWW1_9EURO|nr:Pre-mRNA-processing ATP-dependent RNA helicase prp5 [Penicillium canariense]KAJ5160433.1 Pre-mRNA-processing ATP-dependent RNA helicase prp5 [Penicillium canariense]